MKQTNKLTNIKHETTLLFPTGNVWYLPYNNATLVRFTTFELINFYLYHSLRSFVHSSSLCIVFEYF